MAALTPSGGFDDCGEENISCRPTGVQNPNRPVYVAYKVFAK